jgi:ribonuclease BN (tRNA processing enzyme)
MVRITFLGTKGDETVTGTSLHHGNTAWLLESGKERVLFDFGKNHQGDLKRVAPTAIVLSHAHSDHVEGLKGEAVDVPVFMSKSTDAALKVGYEGIKDRRILKEGVPQKIDHLTVTAYHTQHSTRAPSIALKIETAEDGIIGWVSDVISVGLGQQFFKGLDVYLGDASYFHGGMVRRLRGEVVGHTSITTQLGWVGKHGVKQAIFSHFGDWITEAGETGARKMFHEAAPHVTIYLARDGAVFSLTRGQLAPSERKAMSALDKLTELAEKAREVARSLEEVKTTRPAAQGPKHALILSSHHARMIIAGKKTLVVKTLPIDVGGNELYMADDSHVHGVVKLSRHKVISIAEFRRREKEHCITEEERKKLWPTARRLFAHQVEKVTAFPEPREWQRPSGNGGVVDEPRFKRDLRDDEIEKLPVEVIKQTHGIRVIAEGVLPIADLFARRAPKLMPVTRPVIELMARVPHVIKSVIEEYAKICKLRPAQSEQDRVEPLADYSIFIQVERLLQRLKETLTFLPPKTRLASITENAIKVLQQFSDLDAEYREGDSLIPTSPWDDKLTPYGAGSENRGPRSDLYSSDPVAARTEVMRSEEEVSKFQKPEGSLPTLKLPDPAFNMKLLHEKRETGMLSRLERTGRAGERQFLVNELEPTKADGQYVWGVVAIDNAVKFADLSKIPDDMREGIDPFSREEFSTESPVFFMRLRLIASYDPPLRLKQPVASRRFGPAVTLPDALAKRGDTDSGAFLIGNNSSGDEPHSGGAVATTDVPPLATHQNSPEGNQLPALTWRGISPDKLRNLHDDELKRLLFELERILSTAEGKESSPIGGLSPEDATTARQVIVEEMRRRGVPLPTEKAGPSNRYAPCRASGESYLAEGDDEPSTIHLEEVLPHFHEEFLIRSPFIHIVGGVANNGQSQNDLDILIKGPLDPVTAHIVKVRLGRMLPPELSSRTSYHGADAPASDVSAAGPFAAHVPLYDLVVRRRDDSRAVIEMRDAGMLYDPLEVMLEKAADLNTRLPAKETTFPAVLQAHIRGKSIHGDLRIKQGAMLAGYTLAIQKPGVSHEFETLAEAKAFVSSFDRDGSKWNKPLVNARVYATPKAPEPEEWLRINAEEFAPGTVGATRLKKAFMVSLARPTVSRGTTEPYFQEWFLEHDPKFFGLLTFRIISGHGPAHDPEAEAGRKTPEGESYYIAMLTKSLVPSVVKRRAVTVGRIPPQGWACLPPGLKSAVPKQWQYWHAKDEKERKGIRDELVSEGFFNDSNVRMVDHTFKRVITKYYLSADLGAQGDILHKHQPSRTASQDIEHPRTGQDDTDKGKKPCTNCRGKDPVEKKESIRTMTLAGGQKLADVQVWDPANIKPSDDKTHDRERLRPLAFYKPMKVAPRATNEFHSTEMERLFKDFATEAVLKVGIYIEPKWNGFRASMQKDAKGRQLMISEDIWRAKGAPANFLDHLPGLKEELGKLKGPYVIDGEFMAVTTEGAPVPRRELADFRSTSPKGDVNVRVHVFDILYDPGKGNVMALPLKERLPILAAFLKGKHTRLVLTPHKLVHTKKECLAAIEWARKVPGSEGAMLKSAEATVTLRETDSMAKLKMIREIRGIVWDAHPVKDSPGVHNFMYAIGPVSVEEAKRFTETVEVKGKIYVKAGKTFNTKIAAKVGDVVRIEVTEMLLDESNPEKKRFRGFTPTVIDKTAERPSGLKEIMGLLDDSEIKKSADEIFDHMVKNFQGRFEIMKKTSDKDKPDEQYVLGVVLEPETVDSQGDIYDAEVIRQAAFHFMRQNHMLGLQHQSLLQSSQYEVLENYIAPVDFEIEGQPVKKGTWMLGAHILDQKLWEAIKDGRLTGWSIEGTALVQELR